MCDLVLNFLLNESNFITIGQGLVTIGEMGHSEAPVKLLYITHILILHKVLNLVILMTSNIN